MPVSALVGPSQRHNHEVADAYRDLVVATRAQVAYGRQKRLDHLHRGREATDRIVFKARSGRGHCPILVQPPRLRCDWRGFGVADSSTPTLEHMEEVVAVVRTAQECGGGDGDNTGALSKLNIRHIIPLGGPDELASLRSLAQAAEIAKFTALLIEERPDSFLDPVVVLASLSGVAPSIGLGIMVTGDSGRPPSVLAKLLSGLDIVTGGRTHLMIDARGDSTDPDLARAAEQVELILKMLTQDVTTYEGRNYQVDRAWNTPRTTQGTVALDKVVVACTPAAFAKMAGADRSVVQSSVLSVDPSSWDRDAREIEGAREQSTSAFTGAMVTVQDDVAQSLDFASSIAERFSGLYLHWSNLPSSDDLALCAQLC